MNQALFDKLWTMAYAMRDAPVWIYPNDEALAAFCVCAFLRWGFEPSYGTQEWAEECDIYLLTHGEPAPKGAL